MVVSFLFSYKVLSQAFNDNITTDFAVVSKKALDLVAEIIEKSKKSCYIRATSQAVDKICNELNNEQGLRLRAFIEEERTTQGVNNFDPVTSTTESAKSLSRMGPTIVVVHDEHKNDIHKNPRIKKILPKSIGKSMKEKGDKEEL